MGGRSRSSPADSRRTPFRSRPLHKGGTEHPPFPLHSIRERLCQRACRSTPALLWKPCIKRGLVKQATMTTPYGVTLSGMKQQLREVILEDEDYRNRFPDEKAAAACLAPKVNKAIGQVVIGAAEVRAWLRKLVKKLARKDLPLSWTVPTGFPVLHEYRK
ncbi:MAG: hypothetical protein HYU75_25370, partial [Betaproteobacteria bacterium]|nr:hypothetical protein [Betaproteobacteria bacterium]